MKKRIRRLTSILMIVIYITTIVVLTSVHTNIKYPKAFAAQEVTLAFDNFDRYSASEYISTSSKNTLVEGIKGGSWTDLPSPYRKAQAKSATSDFTGASGMVANLYAKGSTTPCGLLFTLKGGTKGYGCIKISYLRRVYGAKLPTDYVVISYSYDNTNWYPIETIKGNPETGALAELPMSSFEFSLPQEANNKDNLYIKFECISPDVPGGTSSINLAIENFTIKGIPLPQAPQNLRGTAFNRGVYLEWDIVESAVYYNVWYKKENEEFSILAEKVTDNSYSYTGLSNGEKYYFAVSAVNEVGESSLSNIVELTPQMTVPAKVTGLKYTIKSSTITLSWDKVPDAVYYTVKMKVYDENQDYFNLAENVTDNCYAFSLNSLELGKVYLFAVSARNEIGEGQLSDPLIIDLSSIKILEAPKNVTATPYSGKVTLKWDTVENAIYYVIRMSTQSGGPYSIVASGVQGNSYTVLNLTNGTTYYFVISAVNEYCESELSSEVSATPQSAPSKPSGVVASSTDRTIFLRWNAVSGAEFYTVKWSLTNGGPYEILATNITTTSYTYYGVQNGITYYFVVSASNKYGESSNSSQVYTTPQPPVTLESSIEEISDIVLYDVTNASGWTTKTNLQEGDLQYGDRSYKITYVPDKYKGVNWIQTAGSSKNYFGETLIEFTVNDDVYIYVAMDERVNPIPDWLKAWEKTDDYLIEEGTLKFNIYKKSFKIGERVKLGPNGQSSGCINYTIIIERLPSFTIQPLPEYVNQDVYLKGVCLAEGDINVVVNGSMVYEDVYMMPGKTFEYKINLQEGKNIVEVKLKKKSGTTIIRRIEVIKDTEVPQIKWESELPNKVTKKMLTLSFSCPEDVKVSIVLNKQVAYETYEYLASNTILSKEILLQDGDNEIVLELVDRAGNKTLIQKNIFLTCLIKEFKFVDANNNVVAKPPINNIIKVSSEVYNDTGIDKEVWLLLVLYDKDNKVLDLVGNGYFVGDGEDIKIEVSSWVVPNTYRVKAFIWDNIENMIPFDNDIILKLD